MKHSSILLVLLAVVLAIFAYVLFRTPKPYILPPDPPQKSRPKINLEIDEAVRKANENLFQDWGEDPKMK